MGATTTQGTGPGSVSNIKPLVVNGSVMADNVAPSDKSVVVTDSTVTLTKSAHAGKVVVLARAAGVTVTLPAALGNGDVYTIVVGTTVTSNADVIKVANTNDSLVGRAVASADDNTTPKSSNIWNAASGDDTITLNGGTKGGYAGDYIQLIDIDGNSFLVNAFLKQTATEATPFSATV